MNVKIYKIFLFVIIPLFLLSCTKTEPSNVEEEPLQVLFIGNSYTSHNDMPEMFANLMNQGCSPVNVTSSAKGGWTLTHHSVSKQSLGLIDSKNWDYIIIQEQSIIPALPGKREEVMYPALRVLHKEVQKSGAEMILFLTWGRRDGLPQEGYPTFESMQDQLNLGYMQIGEELGATIAPVGIAWRNAILEKNVLELWESDGSHPSQEGSYLTACVFFSMICNTSSQGINYYPGLPKDTAIFLQRIATEAVFNR